MGPEPSRAKWIIGGIIALALAGGGGYYYYQQNGDTTVVPPPSGPQDQDVDNFTKEGNLVRNNPGMKPDTWFLVYDEPGAAALTVELVFTERSVCTIGDINEVCTEAILAFGARVIITGFQTANRVFVHSLTQIDLEEKG